jgi:AcrR family transcriptional regulator
MTDQTPALRRVVPRQARAQACVEAILEAAAQILEAGGEAAFNTNAIAERAGVSIGAVYRYFPDKQAILVAMSEREQARVDEAPAEGRGGDRAMIRAFLHAFDGRRTARRAAVRAQLAISDPKTLAAGFDRLPPVLDADGRPLTPVQQFVLSRAIHGAMRAAVLEDQPFLHSQELEDELVRLGRAYLGLKPQSH